VLTGESIEVEEWSGRGETWRLALAGAPPGDLRLERDPVTGEVLSAWVRWSGRAQLHDAGPEDRVYALERATGTLRFGHRVPIGGRRVVASYRAGGSLAGTVPAGSVTELRLVQPLIAGVTNPVAAAGGADPEPLARALTRGPEALRHRRRALSTRDIEWLAREASPEVARVRCLPVTGPAGAAQRGQVTVLIAPQGTEPRPQPSQALARTVADFLARHGPATAQIRVLGVRYVRVSVRAVIVPRRPDEAALVEGRARQAIDAFLHPLLGSDGDGWQLGQAVPLSALAAVLDAVPGLSHAEGLVLAVDGALCGDYGVPGGNALPSAGPHELVMRLPGACR
jgi:predicted phage baseplate assembly protein